MKPRTAKSERFVGSSENKNQINKVNTIHKLIKSQSPLKIYLFEIFWTTMEVFLSVLGVIFSLWYLVMTDTKSTILVASIIIVVITATTMIKRFILYLLA